VLPLAALDRPGAGLPVSEGRPSASRPTPAVHATPLATGTAAFIENRGQFDGRVKFQLKSRGGTLWLTDQGIVFDTIRPQAGDPSPAEREPVRPPANASIPSDTARSVERLVFAEEFLGTHRAPSIEASQPLQGRYNYFLGNDPTQWRTDVRGYAEVVYRDVWDGINLRLYRNGSDLEQEFVVRPGGDLTQIRVAFKGIDGLHVATDGS